MMTDMPPALAALKGCVITRLTIDDALGLALCGEGRELSLRIDAPGELHHAGGVHAFDPDRDPRTLGDLICLLNQRVDDVRLHENGGIEIVTRESRVTVPPEEHQMAWTVTSSDGARASCIAEGRVVWE
jgi:hypothetical protein